MFPSPCFVCLHVWQNVGEHLVAVSFPNQYWSHPQNIAHPAYTSHCLKCPWMNMSPTLHVPRRVWTTANVVHAIQCTSSTVLNVRSSHKSATCMSYTTTSSLNQPIFARPFFFFMYIQVATALLVAGSTPTFWIPQFVSTSSYSNVVQALGCSHNCRCGRVISTFKAMPRVSPCGYFWLHHQLVLSASFV